MTVHIPSIGSQRHLDYLGTQKQIFGAHRFFRNFSAFKEQDAAVPLFAIRETIPDVPEIGNFGKTKAIWNPTRQLLMAYLKLKYFEMQFHAIISTVRADGQECVMIPHELRIESLIGTSICQAMASSPTTLGLRPKESGVRLS